MQLESLLLGKIRARGSSMFNQARTHEFSSPTNRVSDKETDATKLTPISLLTEDILIEIIHIVSHPGGNPRPHDYVRRLHTLAQVCFTWASIIRQTPSLWSLVCFDTRAYGAEWITALKRSQSSRIAVECFSDSRKPPEPFWSAIKTHSHRWKSLAITSRTRGGWVEISEVRAPFLDELSLFMSGEELFIDRENFPNVSALTLAKVSLPDWGSELLSGLRYLNLGHTPVRPPSLQQLLNMLAGSPRLEYLKLQVMDPPVDHISGRRPPILLPELRNIKFVYLPAIAIDVIMQSIYAAGCPILDVTAEPTPLQRLDISKENFPNASSLILMNIGLQDWSSGLLSGLRFLCLSSIPAVSPSLQQLLDILAASPYLEQLKLSKMAPIVDGASVRNPPIPLPDLRDLYFNDLPTIAVDIILQSIHAVYCPLIDMNFGSQVAPAQSLFPAVASFVTPSIYRYFTTARAPITMTPCSKGFDFIVDSEKYLSRTPRTFSIAIRWFSNDTDAMITWVDSLTESKTSNPYPFSLTVNFVDEETVDRICASKWRLTHIQTVKVSGHATELCQFLSSPIHLGNGRYGWPGPDVRKIIFDGSIGLDAEVVIKMVRCRMTASRGVDQNNLTPLEELVILGGSSIAKVPVVEVEAGKEQMTCGGLMEAVERIIAAGTCSSSKKVEDAGGVENSVI
ncbi:hypothetical protein FRB95_013260 [Tulasnella sp. JGI-2019a]|nr:hypothetical protein FRB95_013260 [Tulasnella sp. JGI-2019a]